MFISIVFVLLILIDLYTFKGIRMLTAKFSKIIRKMIYVFFWAISGFMVLLIILGFLLRSSYKEIHTISIYYYLFGTFVVIYIPKIVFIIFHLLDDILHSARWIVHYIRNHFKPKNQTTDNSISRLKFLSQIGLAVASVPFISFIGGIVKGRFDFRTEFIRINFPNLPKSFDGLRIVQISDIHIGSFEGYKHKVEEAIKLVNDQKADFLLFTGDLVNNFYEELEDGWIPVLSKLQAKYGKYSILGNHDYGNYYQWPSLREKVSISKKLLMLTKPLDLNF